MLKFLTISPHAQRATLVARNILLGGLAVALGLLFGRAFISTSSIWYWPVTAMGMLALAIIIFTRPLLGLLLTILVAPFSRFIYLDISLGRGIPDLTLTRVCIGLLVVVLLARLAMAELKAPRLTLLDGAVLLSLLGIGASLPASYEGLRYAITSFGDSYLVPGLIYLLARCLVRTRRDVDLVVSSFVALGVILATVAIHEQVTGDVWFIYSERSWVYTKSLHRLAGLLGSPAFFATLMAMSASFTVYRFAAAQTPERRLWFGALAAWTALGVYYTYNRTGYISLLASVVILAVAWPHLRKIVLRLLLVVGILAALQWTAVQQSTVVQERLGAMGPVEYRLEIWSHAGSIFARSPILGLGYGNFGTAYLRYNPSWAEATVQPAPHNSLLEVTFDSGLLGGVPYAAVFAITLYGAWRFLREAWLAIPPEQRRRSQWWVGTQAAGLILVFAVVVIDYLLQAMFVDMISGYYVNMVLMLAVGSLFGWQIEERYARRDPGPVSA